MPSAIPCSLCPLNSRIHSRLFSDWRRPVSSEFFDTQVPSISTEEPGVPSSCSLCPLSSLLQWTQPSFRFFISLGLAESRILPSAPVDTRPRTPLILFCTVQLWTFCAAHSLATLCLFTTCGPDPWEFPRFWRSMVFRHAPIPLKGSGKQQQQISHFTI